MKMEKTFHFIGNIFIWISSFFFGVFFSVREMYSIERGRPVFPLFAFQFIDYVVAFTVLSFVLFLFSKKKKEVRAKSKLLDLAVGLLNIFNGVLAGIFFSVMTIDQWDETYWYKTGPLLYIVLVWFFWGAGCVLQYKPKSSDANNCSTSEQS